MSSQVSSKSKSSMQKLLRTIYYNRSDLELQRVDSIPPSPHKAFVLETNIGYFLLKTTIPSGTRPMRLETKCPSKEGEILNILQQASIPVPAVIGSDTETSNSISSPFLLRSYVPGPSLAAVAHRLTSYDADQIQRRLGFCMRAATNFTMGQFGQSNKVLAGQGYSTWRHAFHALLESALRDAEDAVLTLPYDSIRYWVGAHMSKLEVVQTAHLVPLRAGGHDTVILEDSGKSIVCIVGWAEVVWGDPALGEAFANPSEGFWVGFGGREALGYGDGYDDVRGRV
jgi:hypothetical protein